MSDQLELDFSKKLKDLPIINYEDMTDNSYIKEIDRNNILYHQNQQTNQYNWNGSRWILRSIEELPKLKIIKYKTYLNDPNIYYECRYGDFSWRKRFPKSFNNSIIGINIIENNIKEEVLHSFIHHINVEIEEI